jgi:AraC-like DNA-binding protein
MIPPHAAPAAAPIRAVEECRPGLTESKPLPRAPLPPSTENALRAVNAYCAAVINLTGVRLDALVGGWGKVPPGEPLCAEMIGQYSGCTRCRRNWEMAAGVKPTEAVQVRSCRCVPGLARYACTTSVPGLGELLLCSGHVAARTLEPESLSRRFAEIGWSPNSARRTAVLAALRCAPVVDTARFAECLIGLVEHLEGSARPGGLRIAAPPVVDPRWVAQARRYIEGNITGRILRAAVARAIGMSPYHFSHLFRRQVGCTLGQYVAKQRVALAQALLADERRSIEEVAATAGFGSVARFYAAFRQATQTTPRRFRLEAGARRGFPEKIVV